MFLLDRQVLAHLFKASLLIIVGVFLWQGGVSSLLALDDHTPPQDITHDTAASQAQDLTMRSVDVGSHESAEVIIDVPAQMLSVRVGGTRHHLPIVAVPQHGSPDALHAGRYVIEEVTPTVLSSITKAHVPHYTRFGERFAVHGIPTDATGTELPAYVGGSVMVATEDAALLAAHVAPGMEVLVRAEANDAGDTFPRAFTIDASTQPGVSARAFGLRDLATGQTYLVKNEADRYPIASITKLMTATVASELIGHGTLVAAPDGARYTLGDLFYPLLLRSDNAVANKIAIHGGWPTFVARMNAYAHLHGMGRTTFFDSSGLSPRNVSTVEDLLTLALHLADEKEYVLSISREARAVISSIDGETWRMQNQNELARDPQYVGGKLGYTDEAGQTALSVFSVPIGEEVRPVAVVVLNSKDWKQDTRTLLHWLMEAAS